MGATRVQWPPPILEEDAGRGVGKSGAAVGGNGSRAGQDGQDAAGCVAAGGKGITCMSRFRVEELDVAMLVWGGWRRRTGDDAAAETVAKRGCGLLRLDEFQSQTPSSVGPWTQGIVVSSGSLCVLVLGLSYPNW